MVGVDADAAVHGGVSQETVVTTCPPGFAAFAMAGYSWVTVVVISVQRGLVMPAVVYYGHHIGHWGGW